MDSFEVVLPWGPSLNSMYLNRKSGKGKGRILTPEARQWKLVAGIIIKQAHGFRKGLFPKGTPVRVHYRFNEPNRRVRDADNLFKAINDALQNTGIIANDSQLRAGSWEFCEIIKGGLVAVSLKNLDDW